jgi:hypothetical protein
MLPVLRLERAREIEICFWGIMILSGREKRKKGTLVGVSFSYSLSISLYIPYEFDTAQRFTSEIEKAQIYKKEYDSSIDSDQYFGLHSG